MKNIKNLLGLSGKMIILAAIIALYAGIFYDLGVVALNHFWSWLIIGASLYVIYKIVGTKDLSDNTKIGLSFLFLCLIFALYLGGRSSAKNPSYPQEVCPDCDQW
jgi:hypothetical protein